MPGRITTTLRPASSEAWTAHLRVADRLAALSLDGAGVPKPGANQVEVLAKKDYATQLRGSFATHADLEKYNQDVAAELRVIQAERPEPRKFELGQPVGQEVLPSVAELHPLAEAPQVNEVNERVA